MGRTEASKFLKKLDAIVSNVECDASFVITEVKAFRSNLRAGLHSLIEQGETANKTLNRIDDI